ncbi:hypothetical protein Btru_062124 [Bulinus truncatus]|nr:hypothetical protein Btru_062124 [Bulinus truncatus]
MKPPHIYICLLICLVSQSEFSSIKKSSKKCGKIDASFNVGTNHLYFLSGAEFIKYNFYYNTEETVAPLKRLGISSHLKNSDAAFTDFNGTIHILKRCRAYSFRWTDGGKLVENQTSDITTLGLPCSVDAALNTKDEIIVIKGCQEWLYIKHLQVFTLRGNITDRGLPCHIDAAVEWTDSSSMYIKGVQYWKYYGATVSGPFHTDLLHLCSWNLCGEREWMNEKRSGSMMCNGDARLCPLKLNQVTLAGLHNAGAGYYDGFGLMDCFLRNHGLSITDQLLSDNDECTLATHNCINGYNCMNLQGTFRCIPKACPEGQRFDRVKADCVDVVCPVGLQPNEAGNCVDIDECKIDGFKCKRHQKCINTRGSYYCRNYVNCPPGYEPTETTGCQDIDECQSGTHKCTHEQQCINKQGTYFCQCPRGLKHDKAGRCIDVDECSYGAAICPQNSRCVNTIGSFQCQCIEGLVSDGNDSCADVDECQEKGICQQSCDNVLGTYFCSCNKGYQLQDDKRSCEDINECTQFPSRSGGRGVCAGLCINLPGSYRCECPNGFRLKSDGRHCEDINECSEQIGQCPLTDSLCFNIRGSFRCPVVRCPDGFIKINSTGQNSIRCKRISTDCPECRRGLISRTFNFLSFASNVVVPAPLFSMTGSRLVDKYYTWSLELVSARPLKPGISSAQLENFSLEKSRDFSRVTLVKRIDGPQDVILKLSMSVSSYFKGYEGMAESRIYLYITDEDTVL